MQKRLRYCFVIVLICSLISGYAASTKRPSGYPGNGLSNSSFPVGQKDTCADPAFLPDSLETVMKKGRLTGPRYYIQDNGGNPGLKFQYTMNASKSLLNAFSISHDHSYLYTAGKDFLISVWTDQNKIMTLKKHSAQINALAPSKDNQYLVSGGMDNQIIIWLLSKGKPVQKIKKVFDSEIRKILITGNDSSFYCTGDNNIVKRYNLYTGRLEKQLLPHEAELSCILYSPDRSFLITGDISGYIRIWDAGSERLLHSIKTENKICDIQIAQNNRSLVCIDAEGFVSIYDFNNYTLLRKQKTDVLPNPVLGIFNKYILVPNSDRKINVLNYENEQIHVLDPEINGVSSFVADVEKNGLFVLTNSGLVGSFRFNMPGLMPYASDIIDDRYFTSDTIAGIKARMRLYTELIVSAKKILVPITSGSEILPRYEEIQKAIKEFEFALGLLDDSDPIRKADQYRQYLLEAYAALSIYDNEKYPEAEEKMSRIAQDVPEAAYPHNTLSILLSRQNRMKDARNAAAKAIEKAPRWTEPHHNLGQIYQKEHDYDKAIKEYEQIIKKDPENTKGYNDLGVINNQLGSYKKAESYFLQSMKLDSLNPATLINFGELQMNRGRFRDAESLFMSSMSLDAGYGRSLLTFGRFYHTLYQNKPKQEYLEKAFDLILEAKNNEPHNPGCYIELVKLLSRCSNHPIRRP
ncbi:MAG: tetratricopeptide repeat protein, partial [Bacteroidetes bacterium]|nr:tetratricopeptide repeat protein [Bacteroidota bacterium]